MQERYLGDSHDFVKYALLRHLHQSTGMRLGVNWYLTRPEDVDKAGNTDGEQRHHLTRPEWHQWDAELLDQLRLFDDPTHRQLPRLENGSVLPEGTRYFSQVVPPQYRWSWQADAHQALTDSDIVFLDPDNGFEVKSMTRKTTPKYAFYAEAAAWYQAGKAAISIQFARQCDPIKRGVEVRSKLLDEAAGAEALPIIRGRVAPNILFIAIAPV